MDLADERQKQNRPIRILQVVTYMGRGGLETMLMNYYRHIDREKVQFDFLVHRDFRADYDDEIDALGGIIYRLPRLNPVSPAYYKALDAFFAEHSYTVVHSHLDCMSAYPLRAAKKAGVPVRIAHAHNTSQDRGWKYPIKQFSNKQVGRYATDYFACSQAAGEWMFPSRQFAVFPNAIDLNDYSFCASVRKSVRQEFHLKDDCLLIGHVGRFAPQKNHAFLLDIFAEIAKLQADAYLFLVGGGEGMAAIREKAVAFGLADKVIFTGVRDDVNRLLQAMDIFVFPSLYEGLPVTLVEAQASGLPCVISDHVPRESIITDGLVTVQNLDDSAETWAKHILARIGTARTDHSAEVAAHGYDISETAKWLEEFYVRKYEEQTRY